MLSKEVVVCWNLKQRMSGGCHSRCKPGVVMELTSIGKHIGWVTLGPARKQGDIKHGIQTVIILTRAAVEILLDNFVNL